MAMYVPLTAEQNALRQKLQAFVAGQIAPRDAWMDTHGFDPSVYRLLTEQNWMGLRLPRCYGGGGANTVTSMIVLEEIARGSASVALTLGAHWLAAEFLLANGSEAQKAQYLPLAAQGKLFAFGLTESCAGSDAAGIQTFAEQTENGWRLQGEKSWITNSGAAEYYILLAKTDPLAGAKGISAFLIPARTPGLIVHAPEEKMGMRGSITCRLGLEDLQLPADARIGEANRGFRYAMQALDGARLSFGAISVGLAEHAMTIAGEYANRRIAFGAPIAKNQGVSFKFADMSTRLDAARLMTYHTALLRDSGSRITREAAETKLFASEMCALVCHQCQQVLGGNGYARSFHIERLVRDARLLEIAEGTNEILRMLIGNAALSDYA